MRDLAHEICPLHPAVELQAGPALLSASGVSFKAGGQRLINDLDLDIHADRLTVILGQNGAGKSLLLRLFHGLLKPSTGEIRWHGRPLDRAGRSAQAMVFQRPVMLRRSVRANLRFALAVRGFTGRERACRETEALERARLQDLADRPARVLSGGEQQRLAIARALAAGPEILFLDEPTASLDPASTQAIEDLLRAARAEGVTVLLVTHDAGQARRIGEEAVFLHAGRVAETGSVAQVLATPRSEAARAWRDGRLYLDTPTALNP